MSEPRVVLYGRAGCHLCDEARPVVAAAAEECDAGWVEVDIDVHPESEELTARYGDLIPVVLVDGVQQGFWRIDGERLRRALGGGRR